MDNSRTALARACLPHRNSASLGVLRVAFALRHGNRAMRRETVRQSTPRTDGLNILDGWLIFTRRKNT